MKNGSPAAERQSSQAFDRHAGGYGRAWDQLPVVRWLRARVLARVAAELPESASILDLGCGPGTDALLLAELGFRVRGLDQSPGMVSLAQRRGVAAEVADLADPPDLGTTSLFDGALSNFGALNCLLDLRPLGDWLKQRLQPASPVILVVISRSCPMERLALLAQGHPRAALRGRVDGPVEVEGLPVNVRYLDALTVGREMGMTIERVEALGALMAPPRFSPDLPAWSFLEPPLARLPGLRSWGDHSLIVLRTPGNKPPRSPAPSPPH